MASRFFPYTITSTIFYTDHSVPNAHTKVVEIPIQSPSDEPPASIPIPIAQPQSSAAVKIQSVYRSHRVRNLVKKIAAVNSEANYWERLIQQQETVDAVRTSEQERIKINEALISLLFRLDSVPGIDATVRELRRHVSHRIVGLQEILDAVSDSKVQHWDGFLRYWDDVLAGMEKEVCKEIGGGNDMERYCAEHLGFRCLQRFLRDQ
ncbi:BAG family molecular chaperone regulator 5, mitochondrial [Olea europaea subsp. europaea]|uniref:BAG family molecular chaperone regulator 5, mitochondrial n=1 Tax=Olea europaea subsp. europaea TaxID=158383 RepID=A0A8S0VCG9_OLEEU|nr:BAG family molecular chaperone regulator 5, mitochondrial [Olea europaea subsp. europaea]